MVRNLQLLKQILAFLHFSEPINGFLVKSFDRGGDGLTNGLPTEVITGTAAVGLSLNSGISSVSSFTSISLISAIFFSGALVKIFRN